FGGQVAAAGDFGSPLLQQGRIDGRPRPGDEGDHQFDDRLDLRDLIFRGRQLVQPVRADTETGGELYRCPTVLREPEPTVNDVRHVAQQVASLSAAEAVLQFVQRALPDVEGLRLAA